MGIKGRNSAVPYLACGWDIAIPALGATGIIATLIYVSQVPASIRWSVFGTALALVGASAFAGGIVGFLFGIPRTVQGVDEPNDAAQYHGNTNLEQVSDWLSKIIVGVGLVQIGRLLPAMGKLAQNLKVPLGGQSSSGTFGLALVSAYALLGFFFLYLWSRERLPRQLRIAEAVDRELNAQDNARQHALLVVARQLDALKGEAPPTQQELDHAIAAAPGSVRLLIFHEAERIRSANWQDPYRKQVMAQSIPVFRALIAADPDSQYHRIHGSLGWALKDQYHPDWEMAYEQLSVAISIRDRQHLSGWKTYEATRAMCAIHLLDDPAVDQARRRQLNDAIRRDLDVAAHDNYAGRIVRENADISNWESLQHVPA